MIHFTRDFIRIKDRKKLKGFVSRMRRIFLLFILLLHFFLQVFILLINSSKEATMSKVYLQDVVILTTKKPFVLNIPLILIKLSISFLKYS